MASVEPIIVVLGPFAGGTSAVATVLHHLGVFMGTEFDWTYREPHDTWEDYRLTLLFQRAFSVPGGQLQMDAGSLQAKLRSWADEHRRAARIAGRRPGVKHPLLCVAVDFIRDAWGPVVPVVVDRPFAKVVASLNRLGWWKDEQERVESTVRLIAARDLALGDATTIRVDFEALRATPAVVIRRLADELCLEVTEAQVEAAAESIVQPADVPRNVDPLMQSRDLLLAEVERNPGDALKVLFLAKTYFALGDFINARKWYARRVEMGGWEEEVYFAMCRVAESMAQLGAPWPDVQDAYLRAWEFRPTRAEPLYAIAHRYRVDQRYRPGYLFGKRAAEIPLPEDGILDVRPDIYAWRATDEQAVCASWIGKHAEAFTLWRRLLARPDIPDGDRQRIAGNRDVCVPTMIDAASSYPDALVQRLVAGPGEAEVVVSLVAGPDRGTTEQTLNSFLRCCLDVSRVGRFLVVDAGLSAQDRAMLRERYGFLEFGHPGPGDGPGAQLAQIRAQIDGRFWLHLGQGWRFFAPESFITRLTAVLEAEAQVFQVGINFADAVKLTGASAAEQAVRRAPDAGRYVLTDVVASGPAMFDTARLDRAGGVHGTDPDAIAELGRRAAAAGLRTASLDEVLCITEGPMLKGPELSALRDLLSPSRLTHVVDVGANPIDGEPPYTPMLTHGLCHVTGFEPQHDALLELQGTCGPNESYLPYAVGDGGAHTLNICRESGMTSLLTPDPVNLGLFDVLRPMGDVVERVPLQTRRLDDICEIQHLDFLKIDIQGSELAVFQGGRSKLAECVAIQVEVSFVTLYENQPPLGDVDLELRSQGFMPHCFAAVKTWPIAPFVVDGDPRRPLNQLLEADIVYVRDFARADAMTDEQLKHLALIAHHCYGSFDLALRCVVLLEDRRAVGAGSGQRYMEMVGAKAPGHVT